MGCKFRTELGRSERKKKHPTLSLTQYSLRRDDTVGDGKGTQPAKKLFQCLQKALFPTGNWLNLE